MTGICAMERRIVVSPAPLLDWGLLVRRHGRQIRHAILQATQQFPSSEGESGESTVPRKSSKLQHMSDRTANRHRCSGRVDQDERVRGPQGTRQNSGRTFGIRPACVAIRRPQRKIPWQLFTKNTAPCELVRGCIGGDT